MNTLETLSYSEENPSFETFKNKVEGLNEKYKYWLSKHHDIISGTEPVDLHNYYAIYRKHDQVFFNVIHMEEFPKEIQDDLKFAFQESYK